MRTIFQGSYQKGFTLIELMIVVAIVAILVALAVPAYKDYTIRSKIAECVNGAAVAKIQISEYRQALGIWPISDEEAGIDTPSGDSRFCVGFINYDGSSGAFSIDIDESVIATGLGDITPRYEPFDRPNNIIDWSCSRGTTAGALVKYLPGPCRGT
ncbi:MAG: prepilin-type N-terminal cleavage/methylation domain-containing protein [Xanthomonadales bacterium]|nr:prepilin-type N-terminal cleavage/methylation domain-containing protein [Xanthomonadales bacterium]NNL95820.1 prepilin-type N-terminal cleavage/methylation domain-containing protein [Xanthomonadales bacterium]